MKSMRDRYFENYKKIQVPADNRRGFKTIYRYKGNWYGWDLAAEALKKRRLFYLALEAASIAILIAAATIRTPYNTARIGSGIAICAIVPWIAEVWGVIRFAVTKSPMTISDYEEINNCVTIGTTVRVVLLAASVAAAVILTIIDGGFSVFDLLACGGHLLSGAVSILVFRSYKNLRYNLYENVNGEVGKEL